MDGGRTSQMEAQRAGAEQARAGMQDTVGMMGLRAAGQGLAAPDQATAARDAMNRQIAMQGDPRQAMLARMGASPGLGVEAGTAASKEQLGAQMAAGGGFAQMGAHDARQIGADTAQAQSQLAWQMAKEKMAQSGMRMSQEYRDSLMDAEQKGIAQSFGVPSTWDKVGKNLVMGGINAGSQAAAYYGNQGSQGPLQVKTDPWKPIPSGS